ncbi:MAG: VWA domain-containing protein [Rhodobacteraceae bacterium]|nr:VWA domain-containing protein [Paracoccaceae bacterium]
MLVLVDAFHFIRPWLLVALAPTLLLWWRVRTRASQGVANSDLLAPHLKEALTVRSGSRQKLLPVDLVALCLLLLILAAAGPTWSRVPQPFAAQTAPLVVVMKVTQTMEQQDVPPSRLERAKHKVLDLLELRAGARTALVAYSGTAHSVVPMTEDPNVMQPYLEGLSPDIMPRDGNALAEALDLAAATLEREEGPGGILVVLDDLPAADAALLAEIQANAVAALIVAPNGQASPNASDVTTISLTPDRSDVDRVERIFANAYRQALLEDSDQPWEDRGSWLAWPAALLILIWFRRGTTMRWVVLLALMMSSPTGQARAEGWKDWFLTPDQQGWLLYRDKSYAEAADSFADPFLRGMAQYRGGQYEAAADTFSQIQTADAAFAQGMAHIKSRGYRDGVRAFERALELDPDHAGAKVNLPVAKEIVEYVETVREQSDTGEESGIGADDVVFDNEAGRGAETEIEVPQEERLGLMTTEQWMNTVDTRTGDFLRQRFLLEAAGGSEQ